MRTLFDPAGDPASGGTPPGGGGFTPSFDGALKPDGSFNDGWTAKAFGPDYNGPFAQAKNFADVNKMLTDSMTAARAKTEGMIRLPGDNATAEEIAAFHKALGVPDKPEDYGLKAPEKLPDGVHYDAKMEAAFLSKARELGLNAKQVAALRDFQVEHVGQTIAQSKAEMAKVIEAEKAELKTKFGDKLDATVADVKALTNAKWVPDAMKKYLTEGAADPQSGNFAGADFLEFAAAAARAAGEDRGGGSFRGSSSTLSIEEAKTIMGDSSHPMHAKWKSGDADIQARITAAYAAANG